MSASARKKIHRGASRPLGPWRASNNQRITFPGFRPTIFRSEYPSEDYISTPDALQLANAFGGKPEWDAFDHTEFFWFYRDQMREWTFYTDVHTFKDLYQLAADRGLQGFCSWVLGSEDPGIWDFLPNRLAKK
jgi:spore germination protein YaaH